MQKSKQHGFTLIEILISLVVVSFVMTGVIMVFREQSMITVANEDEAYTQGSVQGAVFMLQNNIVMAGFGRDGTNSFGGTNSSGTNAGPDSLTITSAAVNGSAIHTFHLTKSPVVTGDSFNLHCMGTDNTGGKADPARDPIVLNGQDLYILFKSPFDGQKLTGITPNPVKVIASTGPDCIPHPDGHDLNNDGNPDPVVTVTTETPLTSVPRGATVFGYRVTSTTTPTVTYSLDTGRLLLLQNGVPILWGVEDFQVQYQVQNGAWFDSLTAVTDQTKISQVAIGLIVRAERSHQRESDEVRTEFRAGINWQFDHTLQLTADDMRFNRELHTFFVRPRNNEY